MRGGARSPRRPKPVQRQLPGPGARQLRAGRQVGRPAHTRQSVPRGRSLNLEEEEKTGVDFADDRRDRNVSERYCAAVAYRAEMVSQSV